MADIEQVQSTDTFKQGREKWNSNDTELESRIVTTQNTINNLTESNNAISYNKLSYSDGTPSIGPYGNQVIFPLNSFLGGMSLTNGTVKMAVNGVEYASNRDQTTVASGISFYITDTYVVWTGVDFTLDEDDQITVYYQKGA
tara:strand:- start:123 stop:548 length:426 start_codon:yes stop_codon:yes gene_type:complete